MKRILLTTTSLVLAAGVASAETSITWSGAATAGIAREGAIAAVASSATTANIADLVADYTAEVTSALSYQVTQGTTAATTTEAVTLAASSGSTEAALRADVAAATVLVTASTAGTLRTAALAKFTHIIKVLDGLKTNQVVAVKAKDFATYSELNATVTGSVTADNGMTITAAMSVDAGLGYDFADDDGFDTAAGGIGLDNVTIGTAMGTFKIDEGAVAHLVDGDDDGEADILYTNTFGAVSFSAAVDISEDTDLTARKKTAAVLADATTGSAGAGDLTITTDAIEARAADVQWSAKVSMPVAGGTAYIAMDEEGGNIFGASTTLNGIGISFSSKLEALEEELSIDRENNIGLTYVMGTTTLGASWNSKEDGDQWGISAAYAADGMSISASTDEGSDWAVSGSYALGSGASVVGGMNYTEDAYLGLSFAF